MEKERFALVLGDDKCPIVLQRQRRKTMVLRVLLDGSLEVRAPEKTSVKTVRQFVHSKASWIRRARHRQLEQNAKRWSWQPGALITVFGQPRRLEVCTGDACDEEVFPLSPLWGNERKIRQGCLDALRPKLAELIDELVVNWAWRLYETDATGTPHSIRWMRSRWASCSRDRRMRFNLALVFLPQELVELVVVHELCHWQEFSHGRRFYALLASALPDWKKRDEQLKSWDYVLHQ